MRIRTATADGAGAQLGPGALYRLLAWLSPAFPIGAYSYSHGLEFAVEAGLVTDEASARAWIGHIVGHGAGRSDAVLLKAAWTATADGDDAALDEAAELALALRGTAETALESAQQGTSFLAAVRAAWGSPALDRLAARGGDGRVALPVAVGVAAAGAAIPLAHVLAGYLHAFAANLASAAVRLVPLGQTDGQRLIAGLEPVVAATANAAGEAGLDDVGTAAPMVDWTSIRHETQHTRLFRS